MPPETFHFYPLVTPNPRLLSRESRIKHVLHQKYYQGGGGRMKFTKYWKLIPLLAIILSTASIFRFLMITMMSSSSLTLPFAALPPIHDHDRLPHSSTDCAKNISSQTEENQGSVSIDRDMCVFTDKETRFVLEFFSSKVPCNLLVYGLQQQYSSIASMNVGGITVFLEDENQNPTTVGSENHTRVYRIKYNTLASDAYRLLKDARRNPECLLPNFLLPNVTKCNLALLNLPREVYDTKWDVVIVDGPDGGKPDSPGRMTAIYTASALARRGNTTHILVHDVDRMIEKWFSMEFLCEENLVSSKGRFWHFQVLGVGNATAFCTG